MKFSDLKVGHKVFDTWFPDLGTGTVAQVFKTRAVISYPLTNMTYDRAHVQFLQRSK